jgi:multidrug transporter EmrE-like cation transporter
MYKIMDVHFMTVIIIIGTIMVPPIYALGTYVFSEASRTKGMQIGIAFLAFGSLMGWVCLSGVPRRLGLIGNLIVPVAWILPSLILYLRRNWFLSQRLSQKWLIGLQVFRVIGSVFLIEVALGNIPATFAYPAGIGDIFVALVALTVLLRFRHMERIPWGAVLIVIVVGVLDFLSAFFFGFFSSETPLQLFFPAVPNTVVGFPTGMIPLFFVPYAIFFHTLSALNYDRYERAADGESRAEQGAPADADKTRR